MTVDGDSSLDLVLETLADRRARLVAYYVAAEDVTEINELYLAREVAAWETGIEPEQVPTETATDVLATLQEETLPRLDRIGLVAYDPGRGTVRFGDPPEQYERILRILQSVEQPERPGDGGATD